MAHAQFNAPFNHANVGQHNAPGAAHQGPANDNDVQQPANGGQGNHDGLPDMQQGQGPNNVPHAGNDQQPDVEERMVVISMRVMRMWEDGHVIARNNQQRVAQGLVPLVHPPMSRWQRSLLVLLAEERRDELRRQWNELNDVERVLGIDNMQ